MASLAYHLTRKSYSRIWIRFCSKEVGALRDDGVSESTQRLRESGFAERRRVWSARRSRLSYVRRSEWVRKAPWGKFFSIFARKSLYVSSCDAPLMGQIFLPFSRVNPYMLFARISICSLNGSILSRNFFCHFHARFLHTPHAFFSHL